MHDIRPIGGIADSDALWMAPGIFGEKSPHSIVAPPAAMTVFSFPIHIKPLRRRPVRCLKASCDQFLHDFIGATVDTLDASVSKGAGDRVFPHVAVTAVQLQAFVHNLAL